MVTAERYHDISCGHRVVGHESKCRHLHGHNYRVHFTVGAENLDAIGRVMDFSVIKEHLCMWLEDNWDHKFLAWEQDPVMLQVHRLSQDYASGNRLSVLMAEEAACVMDQSIVFVPFNPTAENMAEYLVKVIGPKQLHATDVTLVKVVIEETRKCSCTYTKELA